MSKRETAIRDNPYLYLAVSALASRDDLQELRLMDKYLSHYIGWGIMWDKNRKIALEHKAKAEKIDKILKESYPTKNQQDFNNFEELGV